ncbi:MAG: PSD1 and planctomycete cytochrome C domain-containing protein [Akkermansiaceae bacterium]
MSTLQLSAEPVDFARQVLPILSDKCFTCHGPDADKDEVRLDSFEGATADLGGYFAIDLKNLAKSELIYRIHDKDDPMPPDDAEKQLTAADKAILKKWVLEGGKYAEHWAFVLPKKAKGFTPEKGIDHLIHAELKNNGHMPAPTADRRTLARRAAFVLTGLPPEPEQLEVFIADKSQGAYAKYLSQLMKSPRYGEHQARYWLDAVRYGDTHGLHLDNKRGIFPYRDWVVRAFNANMPFDQFIKEQLAGDLLPDPTPSQLVATGFVRMNPSTAEGGAIPAEFQAKNSFDRTEMFGTVMLGMSMGCARCHTHKYDPITHTDYFQMYAFFNNTAEKPLDGNKYDYAPTIKVPVDQQGWEQWEKLNQRRDKLLAAASADKLASLADPKGKYAKLPIHKQAIKLTAEYTALKKTFTTSLIAKELVKPRVTKLLHRGEYSEPTGEPLEPAVPKVMGAWPKGAPANRLGLSQWLVSSENPLMSRVIVNRIWQSVFGYGLVRTPEDFGLQGEHPTHPELLDSLAIEFQESGWDVQHMLELMLTSKTFRQDSSWRKDVTDPENRLYARGPSFRLDAEVLRDTSLWASRLLDPTMGGAGVKPPQPKGLWSALMHPASNTKNYKPDADQRVYRRSLYVYWKRTSPHPMMTLFDAPSRESSCVGRTRSNTALQSLGMFNETQRVEASRALAERILTESKTDASRLDQLYQLLTCRKPTADERVACEKLLKLSRQRFLNSEKDARALLKTGMHEPNPKLPVADLAAWTQLVTTVLASDAVITLY